MRTAQNLLNLKEPILSDSKCSARYQLDNKRNNASCTLSAATSTLGRKFNSRESRLSIQSSTDDSVHSTSSSRNETDEETNNAIGSGHIMLHNHHDHHNNQPQSTSSSASSFCGIPSTTVMMRKNLVKSVASSVDDESGFSSMNSFQEIGLPATTASGTIIDKSEDSSAADDITIVEVQTNNGDYYGFTKTCENDGLPIVHRRWSSAPPIPPKRNALTTFTKQNGDEALKVLWV